MVYKSKALAAAQARLAEAAGGLEASEAARAQVSERDAEVSARVAELQRDMAAHVVRETTLPPTPSP